jgi:hypothetical protein
VKDIVLKKIDMQTTLKDAHHAMCICHMMEQNVLAVIHNYALSESQNFALDSKMF